MEHYLQWILRHRIAVIVLTVLVSTVLGAQVGSLRVIIDPYTNLPHDHPYTLTSKQVDDVFASNSILVIGVTALKGTALQPPVLSILDTLTRGLARVPGVRPQKVFSLASHRAKAILGTEEGLEVTPFLDTISTGAQSFETLRARIALNPVYTDWIISKDHRTVAILLELKEPVGEYQTVVRVVQAVINDVRDDSVDIVLGGWPLVGAQLERYSNRMLWLFPLAVLLIGLIHYEAFRTVQGLILPLVTALLAVLWTMGIMGLSHVPIDAFNVATPILVLAVAAGHAVQILKRYYEEYRPPDPPTAAALRAANTAAVLASLTRIGPVMLAAGLAAALAFFSLAIFKLPVIRTFGIFTGLGILSALILELTFIPALRSLLPAPGVRERSREHEAGPWDHVAAAIARVVTTPSRHWVYLASGLLIVAGAIGAVRVTVEDSMKSYFFDTLPFQEADRTLNANLGGTQVLFLLIEGSGEQAMQAPDVLRAMVRTQRYLEGYSFVGKTVSLADYVSRMHKAMHGEDPAYETIPDDRDLIAQYLFLYSMSGQPDDFESVVDYPYRSAVIWAFLKNDRTTDVHVLLAGLPDFLNAQFGEHARVRIGGPAGNSVALHDVIVHGKLLNMAQIAAVILVIASLLFRSVIAGLFVLVPLSSAVLVNFGLMGFLRIPLSTATAVISAMAVGIGADYAIYLIYRLREELGCGQDAATAVRTTITTAGKAILYVASAVAGGYSILLFSWGFKVHMWFALLTSTAMVVSSLSALTLLPSLIWTVRPRFVFAPGSTGWSGVGLERAPQRPPVDR